MKKVKVFLFMIALLQLFVLTSCVFDNKYEYYSDKNNYIEATGVISFINYNEDRSILYVEFSDLNPVFDDTCFKIVGDSLKTLAANDIDNKIEIGTEIKFITAPRYFGDGYVMPIVEFTVGDETLLEFEEGYKNLLEWIK